MRERQDSTAVERAEHGEAQERTQEQSTQRRTGRPTLCSVEIAERLAAHIREIGSVQTACDLEEISRSAFDEWMERGAPQDGEEPFRSFARVIKRAQAEFKRTQLMGIRDASERQWTARAWLAERLYPDEFAQKTKTEHSGQISTSTAPVLTPSEWQDRRARILGERETGPN